MRSSGFIFAFLLLVFSLKPILAETPTSFAKCALNLRNMDENPLFQSIHSTAGPLLAKAVGPIANKPWFQKPAVSLLEKFMRLKTFALVYADVKENHSEYPLPVGFLRSLNITPRSNEGGLHAIPKTGGLVVVANHPFGMADGLSLYQELKKVRPDLLIMSTSAFSRVPELSDPNGDFLLFDAHNPNSDAAKAVNSRSLARVMKHLKRGKALMVFPAAMVSYRHPDTNIIADRDWKTDFLSLALRMEAAIVPAFVAGQNSSFFHFVRKVHPFLPSAILGRELLNKRDKTIDIYFGRAYTAEELKQKYTADDPKSVEQMAKDFRTITYDLEKEFRISHR